MQNSLNGFNISIKQLVTKFFFVTINDLNVQIHSQEKLGNELELKKQNN